MAANQIEYYRTEAKLAYAEVQKLETELKLCGVQHKRQALKNRLGEARLQWQVLNLHRENAELEANALQKVMASQVRMARSTLEDRQQYISEAGRTMARRLRELAERLEKNIELGRWEDACYNMASDLPVVLGNSSLDALARARGEMVAAKMILSMAGVSEKEEGVQQAETGR